MGGLRRHRGRLGHDRRVVEEGDHRVHRSHDASINVLEAAGDGDELTAIGEPLHVGSRTHVWQVRVFRGERLAANFVCTQIVL